MTLASHEAKRNKKLVRKYAVYLWKDLLLKIKIECGAIGKLNKF